MEYLIQSKAVVVRCFALLCFAAHASSFGSCLGQSVLICCLRSVFLEPCRGGSRRSTVQHVHCALYSVQMGGFKV